MGQRHQLFVIAKINGRYRNLCAIHHQWLYGSIAVKQCLNILKTFGDGTNRTPIAEELVAASKYNEDFWIQSTDDEGKTKIPFPFVTTCLIIGASFNIDGYTHSVIVEPFGMAYNQGDNNDGEEPQVQIQRYASDMGNLSIFRNHSLRYHGRDESALLLCGLSWNGKQIPGQSHDSSFGSRLPRGILRY